MLCWLAQIQLGMLTLFISPPTPTPNTQTAHGPQIPPPPKQLVVLPMVQCSPFQPGLHSHLPFLHVPCSLQRGLHALWSHPAPVQPSSQRQVPDTQMPWPPQSAAQISVGDIEKGGGRGKRWTEREGGVGREWDGQGRRGVDRTRQQGWRKDKSRSYCQGEAATLHYLVWWQLKRNSCTSWGAIPFDNTNLISPLQRKDKDCGGLSRLILLFAPCFCKFLPLCHKDRQKRGKNPIWALYRWCNTSDLINKLFARTAMM